MKFFKVILISLIFAFCSSNIGAQFAYEWGFSLGGDHTDRVTSMGVDEVGNIYVSGMYGNTVDFDPGAGIDDLQGDLGSSFLAKYNKDGELQWVRDLGIATSQTSPNQLPDLSVDKEGNCYIVGHKGSQIESIIYLALYDTNGDLLWDYEVEGQDADRGTVIHALPSGDCVLGGYFSGIKDFNPGIGSFNLTCEGAVDLFIAKYDKTGALIWAKALGGPTDSQSKIHSITSDADGAVYISGEVHNTFDFDPQDLSTSSIITVPGRKAYMAKYNADAEFLWAKSLGEIGSGQSSELVIDRNNEIVITGRYNTAIDLDPGPDSLVFVGLGFIETYLAKYTSDGELIWGFPMTSSGTDEGLGLAIDLNNNIHFTGLFGGLEGIDLDPSSEVALFSNAGVYDMFYGIYDEDGNYVDAFTLGGNEVDTGIDIEIDNDGKVVIAGWQHSGLIDLDVTSGIDNYTSIGADIYIVKYAHPSILTNTFSIDLKEVDAFPNPVHPNSKIYVELPTDQDYQFKIYDFNGRLVSQSKDRYSIMSPSFLGLFTLMVFKNDELFALKKLVVID